MARIPSAAAAHIGARIASARTRSMLTQDDLASRSSIDSSNIRAYESGRSMPSIHTLMRIAVAMGVPAADLLDGLELEMFPVAAADGRRRVS